MGLLLQEWFLSFWSKGHGHSPESGHPEHYKLFKEEDSVSWMLFFGIFFVLILLDNCVMHSNDKPLNFQRAGIYVLFWISCAASFGVYVYFTRGYEDAFEWGTGYLLEWMLSVDNLFVFRSIFFVFKTPDSQKHKPLFWGIVGAIFFRMGFFVIEELLLHNISWMYVVLGIFLVYTGIKVVAVEDEDSDAYDGPMVRKITQIVPLVDTYAPKALFFAQVDVNKATGEVLAPSWAHRKPPETAEEAAAWYPTSARRSSLASTRSEGSPRSVDIPEGVTVVKQWRMTRLCLVVICLELSDVVFAVDSVSAIVAQIPDLFLAYTACVFAMLGLRATFFFVDELVKLFSLLGYAVATILVFLGFKLILRPWVHVPPGVVCCILIATLTLSLVGSLVLDRMQGGKDSDDAASEQQASPATKDAIAPAA